MIHAYIHAGSRIGVLAEINCQTDFVSRNDDFKAMVDEIGQFLLNADLPEGVNGKLGDAEALEAVKGLSFKGSTLGEELTSAIARIGENMMIGALVAERSSDATDWLQEYKHGARVGVLVCLTTGNAATQDNPKFQELAKDIAMQIAALPGHSYHRVVGLRNCRDCHKVRLGNAGKQDFD